MPPPSKTLSPAELAKLEAAFATDPGSESYKPLAEAYLSMNRFMEAMVVCKKGVKAHPTKPDARILLARVYADQGKDKKAFEELQAASAIAPNDKTVLRMTGSLQLKGGETDAGRANLLKAYEQDPNDAETIAAMAQHNIPIVKPEPVAPPPPPQVVAPPPQVVQAPAQPLYSSPSGAVGAGGHGPPTLLPSSPQQQQPQQPAPRQQQQQQQQRVNGHPANVQQQPPAPRQQPRRTVSAEQPRHYDDEDENSVSGRHQKPKSKASLVMFLLLIIGGGAGIGGYAFWRNQEKEKTIAVNKLLREVDKELRHDSYDGYRKITDGMDKALEIIPDNVSAHGYGAYAWTILWVEHGGGEAAQKNAELHLSSAEKGGDTSASLVAARGLFDTASGKGKQAREKLESVVKEAEDRGVAASSQVYLALGIIAMNQGDLNKAKESLDKAQKGASGDPRVYAALGNLYRRMGQDGPAELNFIYALRYEKGHPESMLGSALLELDKEEPNYQKINSILKTLIEQEPPPSPRQLATAQLARAFMVSRIVNELPLYKAEFQKPIIDATGIGKDKAKDLAEIQKSEQMGFNLDRSNPELNLIKSKRLLSEKNIEGAVAEVREAIKQDPTRAQFYVELARALMSKPGGEKEAIEALQTAVKTMGESPRLSTMIGEAYIGQGKMDDAITALQKATEGKTKNPDARLLLGRAYVEKRQGDKAIEQLTKASEEFIGNTPKVAEAQNELGRAYLAKNDKAKAESAFQASLNADQYYADPYFHYGRLLSDDKKNGNKVEELMKKYLELAGPKARWADEAKKLMR